MPGHSVPRKAERRQASTRASAAAGWAGLAAVSMVALASTAPATAGARLGSGEVPVIAGMLAAAPAVLSAGVQPAAAAQAVTAVTVTRMTAALSAVAYPSQTYATGNPDNRAAVAVHVAMTQIGLPYVWGGDGPAGGDAGFDCSGLTQYAYDVAGISVPRTAHTQFYAGPRVPAVAPLQPGDLVFYGTPERVHHVGMYIGDGRMVNAPTFGEPVQTAYYRWLGDDYVGATRPAASSTATGGARPPIPEPAAPPARESTGADHIFVAPRATLPSTLPAPGPVEVPEARSAQAAITEQEQMGATPLTPTPAAASAGPTVASDPSTSGAAGTTGTTGTTSGSDVGAAEVLGTPVRARSRTSAAADPTTSAAHAIASATASTTTTMTTVAPPTAPPPTTPMPPTTPPPTTPPPTTPPPTTNPPPTTTVPPAATTQTPPPAASARAAPAPVLTTARHAPTPRSAITIGGRTTNLAATAAGPDGLPAKEGVWARAGRPAVRLAAPPSAALGSTVTLQIGTGATASYTVASSRVLTTAQAGSVLASATAGELVVLAAAADGSWTVLTAT